MESDLKGISEIHDDAYQVSAALLLDDRQQVGCIVDAELEEGAAVERRVADCADVALCELADNRCRGLAVWQCPGVHGVAMLHVPGDGSILSERERLWHHCTSAAWPGEILRSLRVAIVHHAEVLEGNLHIPNTLIVCVKHSNNSDVAQGTSKHDKSHSETCGHACMQDISRAMCGSQWVLTAMMMVPHMWVLSTSSQFSTHRTPDSAAISCTWCGAVGSTCTTTSRISAHTLISSYEQCYHCRQTQQW